MLEKVFEILNEKGITLNFDKCIFDKDNLEYYGLIFSKDGIKPSPHKIIALQNVRHLENAKAVRSFLGLTNYLKQFIPNYSTITFPLRKHTELQHNNIPITKAYRIIAQQHSHYESIPNYSTITFPLRKHTELQHNNIPITKAYRIIAQ